MMLSRWQNKTKKLLRELMQLYGMQMDNLMSLVKVNLL